ncbi:MAG TPA: hypothetical protein VLA84_20335 [Microcoleus sp.]|nr:hypothetical protein [Microcoleus sp.]
MCQISRRENVWRYYDRHHQEIDRLIVAHQTDDWKGEAVLRVKILRSQSDYARVARNRVFAQKRRYSRRKGKKPGLFGFGG